MEHVLIGNNRTALLAAGEKSRSLGIPTHLMTASLRGGGEEEAAQFIASLAEEIAATGNPFPPPVCLLFGGETTVTVKGDGQGGRNQELCLAFLKEAGPRFNGCFLSAGTDGIDGNSPAAGAVIHGDSWNTVKRLGLDMEDYLNRNDAFGLWNRTGDAIVIGPTGTNVMDIAILIVGGQSQWQQTYDFQRP
jgi:hydroxypyruvate reductase/glycerate 2-kinase